MHQLVNVVGKPALPASAYLNRTRTDTIFIHCSATLPEPRIAAETIRRWHQDDNGWLDIGYHYVIRADGTIECGRPEGKVGSGVLGANTTSIHICLVGGIDKQRRPVANFEPEQWESLKLLVADVLMRHPEAAVLGHRDFPGVSKACPSFEVKGWVRDVLTPFRQTTGLL